MLVRNFKGDIHIVWLFAFLLALNDLLSYPFNINIKPETNILDGNREEAL